MDFNYTTWKYLDTPIDTFIDCESYYNQEPESSLALCVTSAMVGFISAYILPVVIVFGILSNFYLGYIFLFKFKKLTRQLIYMAFICWSDMITMFSLGGLWLIPAKGLPYATNGRIYYFIIYHTIELCRFYRTIYSISATLASNLLLITSIDRCLSIFYPLKYRLIPIRYAWYLIILTLILTMICIMPYTFLTNFHFIDEFISCWLSEDQVFAQIFSILFNNAGLVQSFLILALNILFMRKMYKTFSKEKLHDPQSQESKEWSATIILFILSITLLIFNIPQCIAYLLAFLFPTILDQPENSVRLANNIVDLAWQCMFVQNATAIFICLHRMAQVREITYKFFRCPWIKFETMKIIYEKYKNKIVRMK